MQAKDIMTTNVVSMSPDMSVSDAASFMLRNGISGMPVVSGDGKLVGLVSEGDLIRQVENPEDRKPSWWLNLFQSPEDRAGDYIKTHGKHVKDVMTKDVVTITEDTDISRIAVLLEKHRIKRVPVLRDGKVVGIVSRANLLRGLAAQPAVPGVTPADKEVRDAVQKQLDEAIPYAHLVTVIVKDGVVQLMGAVESKKERDAIDVAVQNVSGVSKVDNQVSILPTPLSSGWV